MVRLKRRRPFVQTVEQSSHKMSRLVRCGRVRRHDQTDEEVSGGRAGVTPEIHLVLLLEWACMPVQWEKDLVQCESSFLMVQQQQRRQQPPSPSHRPVPPPPSTPPHPAPSLLVLLTGVYVKALRKTITLNCTRPSGSKLAEVDGAACMCRLVQMFADLTVNPPPQTRCLWAAVLTISNVCTFICLATRIH